MALKEATLIKSSIAVAAQKPTLQRAPEHRDWAMHSAGYWRGVAVIAMAVAVMLMVILTVVFVTQPERSLEAVSTIYDKALLARELQDRLDDGRR